MIKKYVSPGKLNKVEQHRYNICKSVTDEWFDGYSISNMIGISYSRVIALAAQLVADGYLTYDDRFTGKIQNNSKRNKLRFFKATEKKYVPIVYEDKERNKYYIPNNYYGVGEFFNPFVCKPRPGIAKDYKLMETKRNDYFKQPLRKVQPVSIGSTFSLY